MSGMVGIIYKNGNVVIKLPEVAEIVKVQHHKGPYGEGN
jgi:asparagine synthetase B (glutamine-hydrolysing)